MELDRNIDQAEGEGAFPECTSHAEALCKDKASALAFGSVARAKRALGVEPVVEIVAMLAAALEVAVIRGLGDLLVRRYRGRSVALPRCIVGAVAYHDRRTVELRNQGIRR